MGTDLKPCAHEWVTSTTEKGPHCCDCGALLVGLFTPIPRNTVAGTLMYAMKTGIFSAAAMPEGGQG